MPEFNSSGVQINYVDQGSGAPVVLVHGFASSLQGNWRAPGIFDALVADGRRVVALDCRGHGRSAKPHDPAAYGDNAMARDVIALMDHLAIDKADLAGYSMGGFISAWLMQHAQERFGSVVLAGVGDALLTGARAARAPLIAEALESPEGDKHPDITARGFRIFAERTGNDLKALAAMQKAPRGSYFDASRLDSVRLPVLVVVGVGDTLVGSADKLAAAIPGARLVTVPGDHLGAVGSPELKEAIRNFLREHSPAS